VLDDRRQRHVKGLSQRANGGRTNGQALGHRAPRRVGQGA
jgi:hypothetical protein